MQDIRTPRPIAYVVDPMRPEAPIRRVRYAPNMGGADPGEDNPGQGTSFVRCRRIPRKDNPKLATWEARLSRFALSRGCFFLRSAYEKEGRIDLWESWLEWWDRWEKGRLPHETFEIELAGKKYMRSKPQPFPPDRLPAIVQQIMAGEVGFKEVQQMEFPDPIQVTEQSELNLGALQEETAERNEADNLATAGQ